MVEQTNDAARGGRGLCARLLVLCLPAMVLTGCGGTSWPGSKGGDPATWQIAAAPEPAADGATLHLGVTRLGCASGRTGTVLEPEVTVEDDRVVINTPVERLSGNSTCQGNDTVPLEVELSTDSVGKDLVDAACLDGGEAAGTAACAAGAARWHLPTTTVIERLPDWTPPGAYTFAVTSLCGERAFLGTFEIAVVDGRPISAEPLDDRAEGMTLRNAMSLQQIWREADDALRGGRTVRIEMDREENPRYVSVGENLAQSDATSCYFIHHITEGDSTEGKP